MALTFSIETKRQLLALVIGKLELEVQNLQATSVKEHELLKEAPGAMQSHSDTTRSQKEALLYGLSIQIKQKQDSIDALRSINIDKSDRIKIGSIVETCNHTGKTAYFFIIPGASGEKYSIKDKSFVVISPQSIVAQSLLNREDGDIVKANIPSGEIEMEIISHI